MKFFLAPLGLDEIQALQKKWGNYLKLTVDIENEWLIAGGELHADGEKMLLEKGSLDNNIWGGGIDMESKQIDTTAVLNFRPNLENNSLEILDPEKRKKFTHIVKKFFSVLWK